ncbi:MAG TPA: DUF488 domain-containing protein [Rhizomicrobium sp.]|nr:DUF488 domain-containing protein [Rhizomicrobium sp.]
MHSAENLPVFTIGHSNRTISAFVDLLRAGAVQHVVDIRRFPRSRANPGYNADILPDELARYGISHARIEELGGRRAHAKDVPPEVNAFWINRSFHNYADYALSASFRSGLDDLLEMAKARRTGIMCAEALWWRCHRRIVADYLMNAGRAVFHLMAVDKVTPAAMTGAAVPAEDGLRYPASRGATPPASQGRKV